MAKLRAKRALSSASSSSLQPNHGVHAEILDEIIIAIKINGNEKMVCFIATSSM
jgi:hypothetical protein